MGSYFETEVPERERKSSKNVGPKRPTPQHALPRAAIVWRCHTRYLTLVLPEGSGGAPPPLGCAVWLPREEDGETRSHRPSSGATSTVNQFTWDVYLAGPPLETVPGHPGPENNLTALQRQVSSRSQPKTGNLGGTGFTLQSENKCERIYHLVGSQ